MTRIRHAKIRAGHRGAALFVGLVMLLLLTLQALAALHTGTTQLRIAVNLQEKRAAEAAVETALGRMISEPSFPADPRGTVAAAQQVDANGDSTPDFTVTMAAECRSTRPLPGNQLDPELAGDAGCLSGSALGGGALCALAQWDVQALAVAAGTAMQSGVRSEIHQGVALRMAASDAVRAC